MTSDYVNSLKDDCGIHHMWPIARDYLKVKGVDLLKETAEICCFAHAVNGGILIDRNAAASVPGLFAAGETAGGPHGADRLGGNMMVTCQVFGAIAGRSAAEFSFRNANRGVSDKHQHDTEAVSELLYKKLDCEAVLAALRRSTQQNLLAGRTENGLKETLGVVKSLESEFDAAPQGKKINLRNFEISSMLTSIKLMAGAALKRKESRGSHHREDFSFKDESLAKPAIINRSSEKLK
jgi:L-aspartate oxidase